MSFGVFQFRRGTASAWTAANPVLSSGEMAIETDTAKFKIGDGATAWNSLAYGGIQGPQGTSPVAFTTITGNTGTAIADTSSDSLSVIGTAPVSVTATDNPEILTVAVAAASTSAPGSMSALDKQKLNNVYIDVTANSTALVLTTNTGAQNVTAINAIMAAAPSGSTLFFPVGVYQFNAAWTWPSKFFYLLGQGQNRSGGESELQWTANVAGNLITLTDGFWYSRFTNLTFSTTVDQTAGYAIQCGNNVGINFQNCSWGTAGGYFNSCIGYDAAGNGGNSCFVDKCILSGFKGTGIRVSSNGTSVVVSDTQVLGQWGPNSGTPTAAQALAGISGGWVGALQINDCDVIGCQNNLLLNPVAANSEVCASVYCTNTYFDNSAGSCIKITGTGATVRCRFDTCSFTTAGTNFTTAGTNLAAVEMSSTFAYGVGGMGVDFTSCNAFNTFSTTGTTNGFLISGAADFTIGNCRVSGWTNGVQITPMATAGRTQPQIVNSTIGPAGGLGACGTGILLNAGAATYGAIQIVGNNLAGNTVAPLTDSSLTSLAGQQKNISNNIGLVIGSSLLTATTSCATTAEAVYAKLAIPARAFRVGTALRCKMTGLKTTATACNFSFTLRYGTAGTTADTAIGLMTLAMAGTAVASQSWTFEVDVFCTTAGASGVLRQAYTALMGSSGAAPVSFNTIAVATSAADMTVDKFLTLTMTPSAAVTTNDVHRASMEVIQQ